MLISERSSGKKSSMRFISKKRTIYPASSIKLWKMRNVLVALVPLCIGLTSGFIVPPGIMERSIKLIKNNINRRTQRDVSQKIQSNLRFSIMRNATESVLSDHKKGKLENDLYENGNKKEADISERSFIYIKQRNKHLLRKSYLGKLEQNNDTNTHQSYLLNRNNYFEELHRRFDIDKNTGNIKSELANVEKTIQQINKQHFVDINSKHAYEISKIKTNEVKLPKIRKLIYEKNIGRSEELDKLIKQALEDQLFASKTSARIDHIGSHYCRNCIMKARNINSRLLIQEKCKCKKATKL